MIPSLILAKTEVTYGVSPAAGAANVVYAENVSVKPMGQIVRGDVAKPGVGQTEGFVVGERYEMSFEVPLAASGTEGLAPKWAPLVLSCGLAETVVADTSVTYARRVNPAAASSIEITYRVGRRTHVLAGARGRVGLKLTANQRPMLTFTFVGLHAAPTTSNLPVQADATWTGWQNARPIAQGRTTCSFNSEDVPLRELTLNPMDNVKFTDLPHQENVQLLGAAGWTGTFKATQPLLSDLNPEALWLDRTIVPIAVVHEVDDGKIVTVNVKAQLSEPSYTDEDGQEAFSVGLDAQPSAINTDDELSIVLT